MTRREKLEAAIERLIDMLDLIDGDPDLEPEPLESSLGGVCLAAGADDLEHDDADQEPWLGWLERENQAKPHHGYMADLDYEDSSPEWPCRIDCAA